MTRTYRNDDNTQLSEHFNVQEFRCKCGQNHEILISDELVSRLETLFTEPANMFLMISIYFIPHLRGYSAKVDIPQPYNYTNTVYHHFTR